MALFAPKIPRRLVLAPSAFEGSIAPRSTPAASRGARAVVPESRRPSLGSFGSRGGRDAAEPRPARADDETRRALGRPRSVLVVPRGRRLRAAPVRGLPRRPRAPGPRRPLRDAASAPSSSSPQVRREPSSSKKNHHQGQAWPSSFGDYHLAFGANNFCYHHHTHNKIIILPLLVGTPVGLAPLPA